MENKMINLVMHKMDRALTGPHCNDKRVIHFVHH